MEEASSVNQRCVKESKVNFPTFALPNSQQLFVGLEDPIKYPRSDMTRSHLNESRSTTLWRNCALSIVFPPRDTKLVRGSCGSNTGAIPLREMQKQFAITNHLQDKTCPLSRQETVYYVIRSEFPKIQKLYL